MELNIKCIDIGCGANHSLCITKNGECYPWGHNTFGNLGNGQHSDFGAGITTPYKLNINKCFNKCRCGSNHNVLLTECNELVVFGDNRSHQCSIVNEKQFESPYILKKK
eukprot:999567_1